MKHILILSLFFSSLSYGQIPTPCTRCWQVAYPVHFDNDTVYFPSFINGDTLYIDPANTSVKAIKVGDKIYRLNKPSPYLEEVKPVLPGWRVDPGFYRTFHSIIDDSIMQQLIHADLGPAGTGDTIHPDEGGSTLIAPVSTGWTQIEHFHLLVDSSFIPTPMEKVCRNISDTRKEGWTAQPWPAILWRKADGTYLDHKKRPLKPWIRVWEN